ncbi:MAG: YdcF family protein [Clostridiales Family XIII bacterium]|jgi:vancomycin permeability regulator SanA|nr:YdcF family protein [Clostridiales Family XIII bacterium]
MKNRNNKTKNKKGKLRRGIGVVMKAAGAMIALAVLFILFTNIYMIQSVKDRIITVDEAAAMAAAGDKPQCIVVLGAAVHGSRPSPILADRLDTGLELYRAGASGILLFSGDNGQVEYNEVEAMRRYALSSADEYGIAEGDIYLDHAGFSTYESMYRLKKVFGADSALVVTQKYHLYRALYTAKKLGVDVYGVVAPPREKDQLMRDIREVIARTKDFCYVMADVQPKYLGEPIALTPGPAD